MGLERYYYDIPVYRQTIEEDDWGNESEDGAPWVLNQTIQGLIEPKSGSKVERNSDQTILSDYLIYTELDSAVLSTDRIFFGDMFYSITNMKGGTGVAFRQHHKEWDLLRIGIENNG